MVNVCRVILQHIKEYCEEAAIHGPQHIVAHRLAVFERLVPIQLASDCTVHDYICLEKIIAQLEANNISSKVSEIFGRIEIKSEFRQ